MVVVSVVLQFANHIKQALTDQVAEARQRKIDDARKAEEEKAAFVCVACDPPVI